MQCIHSNRATHQANLSRRSHQLINYEFRKVRPAGAPEMSLGVTHFNFALCLKLISMSNCPGGRIWACWGIIKTSELSIQYFRAVRGWGCWGKDWRISPKSVFNSLSLASDFGSKRFCTNLRWIRPVTLSCASKVISDSWRAEAEGGTDSQRRLRWEKKSIMDDPKKISSRCVGRGWPFLQKENGLITDQWLLMQGVSMLLRADALCHTAYDQKHNACFMLQAESANLEAACD